MIKELIKTSKAGFNDLIEMLNPFDETIEASHGHGFVDDGFSFQTTFGGVGSQAGEIVSPIRGLAVPAQFACVKVLSEDIGKLPLIPYRRLDDQGKERLNQGSIMRVLRKEVAPGITPMTFKQTLTQWGVNWGNGYAEIVRNARGEPAQLWPIHPSRVKPTRNKDGNIIYIVRFENGASLEIPAKDIIHIRGLGSELFGWNLPVSVAKETMGAALAQIVFAASFFGNGVTPSAVLRHPKNLSDKAQRRLRMGMRKVFGGARNAAKLLVLEEDMEYKAISMPLKQAQFLESRNFSVEEIARYHRMPLHKIQSMKQSTNNNIEQQALEYLTDTLGPWLIRWEQEIDLKFWPNTENFFSEFLIDALLRGDFKSRTEGYSRLFGIGVMSINDIRAKENMNPIPNGNVHFVPLNMVPLQQAISMASGDINSGRDNRRQIEEDQEARRQKISEVFIEVFKSSAGRLVQMEIKALQRAHLKGSEDCILTMIDFYNKHEIRMVESLLTDMKAYFKMLGVKTLSLEEDLKASCKQFCEGAKAEISLAISLGSVNIRGILDKWGKSRSGDIAEAIVEIGLACCEKSVKIDNNN